MSNFMAIEIERKFLVTNDSCQTNVLRVISIRQGYFSCSSMLRARIHIFGGRGFITLKSAARSLIRDEFECEIPKVDAAAMIRKFRIFPLITKRGHELIHEGTMWSIDEYKRDNKGLIVAEVELQSANEMFTAPTWLGKEITDDQRYGNSTLVKYPFSTWAKKPATFASPSLGMAFLTSRETSHAIDVMHTSSGPSV
jgi:adenylate cyclase